MRGLPALSCALLAAVVPAAADGGTFALNCDKRDLQTKIDNVPAGSTILVKGTCVGSFTISKDLTLAGNPSATLDGVQLGRTLTVTGTPTVRLLDLAVTGGQVDGASVEGGGISHAGGALMLRRVSVVNNRAEGTAFARGGGIYSSGGSLSLVGSRVARNVADASSSVSSAGSNGGGIWVAGRLKLARSRVVANRAEAFSSATLAMSEGGGILLDSGEAAIASSHVDRNRAIARGTGAASNVSGLGGGVGAADEDELVIRRSTVSDNSAVAVGPGGIVGARGGAIHGYAGVYVLEDSTFAGSTVRAFSSGGADTTAVGGALRVESNRITLRRSRVTGSVVSAETGGEATVAGGGLMFTGDEVELLSSRIARNEITAVGGTGPASASGGGLHTVGHSILLVRKTTLDANRARSEGPGGSESTGGGLFVSGVLDMAGTTVSRNVASSKGQSLGGGLSFVADAVETIRNSTIADNRASGATARGGGIDSFSTAKLVFATVARNQAKLGGGLYVEGGTSTLRATLLGLNTGGTGSPDCGGSVATAGHNLIAKLTGCAVTPAGSDRVNVGPKLGRLGSHGGPTQTVPIGRESPALNAIGKTRCDASRDQRGVKRPQGRRCDMGAYERKPS